MKLNSVFDPIWYHQITDEELYNGMGNIPVFTGKHEIKGYWNKKIVDYDHLPCIIFSVKGNGGDAYVQKEVFEANNMGILIPKAEWKDRIDLEWFSFKLRTMFLKIQTSKGGVSYINKEIVEDLEINIPEGIIQLQEKETISRIYLLKDKIDSILYQIDKIKQQPIIIEYKQYQGKNISAMKIFDCIGGNSGLTEEYLYSIMLEGGEKIFNILTGSIEIDMVQKVHRCLHPKNSTKKINVFVGEGIHIVRKGKAGSINYLPFGNYTLNDDAYIVTLKENIEYKISLKWIVYTCLKKFSKCASKSDNSTWNKGGFFEHSTFDIPNFEEQIAVVNKFDKIELFERKLLNLQKKINISLTKDLIEA